MNEFQDRPLVGERQAIIRRAATDLALDVEFVPGAILSTAETVYPGSFQLIANALNERVHRPFGINDKASKRSLLIRVQLSEGVMDVHVDRERLFSRTTYVFVLWMLGSSLVLFAVASIFMRNQIRPIRRLARAADSLGKGQEIPDFRPAGATEVRQAAVAFNRMRDRIQRSIAQRTEMLAGVSHDLRTPLTRLKLELEMLGKNEDVAALKDDVAEMERMVDDYLAFARGESTEAVIETDLGQLIDEITVAARRTGARIELFRDATLRLPLKPGAVKRSLTNIVSNAHRYGDHIRIEAHQKGGLIRVAIEDDGEGIPEEYREDVFKPFYRLESSRSRETGGSGLGLAIARDVIRSHGGDIKLGEAEAGGLRVLVTIPV